MPDTSQLLVKDGDELLSVPRVANELGGLSKWTVYDWLKKKKMRRTKVGGRTMIRRSELQRVIKESA